MKQAPARGAEEEIADQATSEDHLALKRKQCPPRHSDDCEAATPDAIFRVELRCVIAGEVRSLRSKISPKWRQQPVRRLLQHFAEAKLPELSPGEAAELQIADGDELLDNHAPIGEVLKPKHVYKVSLAESWDSVDTGNPYWLPLDRKEVLKAVRERSPQELVQLDLEPPPRFSVDDERAYEYLEEHGYVVIAGALTGEEVTTSRELFWDCMEQLHVPSLDHRAGSEDGESSEDEPSASGAVQVDRASPRTWDWPSNPINGIIGGAPLGQSGFLWHVRTRPAVVKAFARVWGVAGAAQLITSFDGASAFRPPQLCERWRTMGGWWHMDQNAHGLRPRTGRCAVQGLVSLYDQDSTTGAFAVIPGSHRVFDQTCERYKLKFGGSGQFIPLRGDYPIIQDGRARLVSSQAGDLVLWDSRTAHCSMPAIEPADLTTPPRLVRLAAYVCMVPASHASEIVLQQRRMYWHFGPSTTHWPDAWEASFQPATQADEGAGERPQELSCLGSRTALELIGWHGMDESFYSEPPLFHELKQVYSDWAAMHELQRSEL